MTTAAPTNDAVKERGAGLEVGARRPVRERPILFSAPMVRALLANTKTQTRRLYKAKWPAPYEIIEDGAVFVCDEAGQYSPRVVYGVPGDHLWVKETWRPNFRHEHDGVPCDCNAVHVDYLADGGWKEFAPEAVAADWTMPKAAMRGSNVTPLFMPRWASRITLEVTEVRVQRLRDISEVDAKAEGVRFAMQKELGNPGGRAYWQSLREGYAVLWDSINGAGSWDANPYVWAVSFRVLP